MRAQSTRAPPRRAPPRHAPLLLIEYVLSALLCRGLARFLSRCFDDLRGWDWGTVTATGRKLPGKNALYKILYHCRKKKHIVKISETVLYCSLVGNNILGTMRVIYQM